MGRQHQGMDRPGVRHATEDSREQGKMDKTGWKIICGAPTTLSVKGLMMMMMMHHYLSNVREFAWNQVRILRNAMIVALPPPPTFLVNHFLLPPPDFRLSSEGFKKRELCIILNDAINHPSSPAKPSMSSAKRMLVIVLSPMLTVPS